jgi:broad specificity phosphatase PhoE
MLVRHGLSVYNTRKREKQAAPLYQQFLEYWKRDHWSENTKVFARRVLGIYKIRHGDAKTPLDPRHIEIIEQTGTWLRGHYGNEPPDVIFVSPYARTRDTLRHLAVGWPALQDVRTYKEERIREQEHGLVLLYNDWRIFWTFHPEQAELREQEGAYWYRYPQGENVPDVRARNRSFITTLIREYSERRVMVVTHHLNILALRANLERWGSRRFIHADEHEKPINCGVTVYRGNPNKGKQGRFELGFYNKKYY